MNKSVLARHLPDFTLLIYIVAVTAGTFAGGLWAGLGIGAGVILFGCVWRIEKKIPVPPTDLSIMAALFFFATFVLNFGSSQPPLSWHEWWRLLSVFVPMLLLLSSRRGLICRGQEIFLILPAAMTITGLALEFWLHRMAPLFAAEGKPWLLAKYNRGFSYLVLLSFPAIAGLWLSEKRWLIVPFLLVLLVPASLTELRSAKLALTLGLMVTVAAYIFPVLVEKFLALGAVLVIGWPFASREFFLHDYDRLAHIPDSWHARIEIWDYMSYRILERPISGWGLGSSHTLPFADPHGAQYIFTTLPAAHPHNVATQLWVELGVPGLVLGVAFAFLTLIKIRRIDPRLVPFVLGAWAACFCLSLIAYDFWTDSLFAAFALTALAFTMLETHVIIQPPSSTAVPEAPR